MGIVMLTDQNLRQRLNDLLGIYTFGVPRSQVRAAINRALMHYLPFMYGMVGFFFLGYAVLQAVVLKENGSQLMIMAALGSATIMLVGGVIFRYRAVNPVWAEPLTAVGAALVLISVVLRSQLTADPRQVANLALFLFGIAIIFVSPLWYALFSILTLGALVLAIQTFPATADEWTYYIVVTMAAMATGLLAHVVRVRAYRNTVVLRIVEQNQRRELQRRAVQLQTAVGVGQRITSILEQEALLQQIATLIHEKYQVYYAGVFLPDESGLYFTAVAQAGRCVTPDMLPLQAGMQGCIGWVMQQGEILRVDNVLQCGRFKPEEATPRTQSELILPLKMGAEILGVVDLQSDRSSAFPVDEVSAFQLLADQMAIALENAHLYAELRRFNWELEQKVEERTQALQEAYARLERLDKTKTDFITIASHELRTPLTIVNFNSQMFLEDEVVQQNEEYMHWLKGINRGVMRMEAVVENILDVAKIDSRSLELYLSPVNMNFLLRQIVRKLEDTLGGRQLTFSVEKMANMPEVEADSEALEKLFYQILVNAIKYTPDGGFIRIDGRYHAQPQNDYLSGAEVEIIISDTGIGIAPEFHDLIFEKFFQTGDVKLHSSGHTSFRGGGSGIGLAIARGIVEAHNGRIWVQSAGHSETEYPGSAFHIVLPVHPMMTAVPDELSSPQAYILA
ncbi:MAG: GAF domain-containing protein [Chloroflexi bacterium]|nr:GAF domain-containing protein [Chloroflexota bacterium]